jgi:glycine dehydrogenase subunit 1
MGKKGLRMLAKQNLAKAHYASQQLAASGASLPFAAPHFNEFVVEPPGDAEELLARLREGKVIGGLSLRRFYPELKNHLLVCVTETVTKDAMDRMAEVYRRLEANGGHWELQATPVGSHR